MFQKGQIVKAPIVGENNKKGDTVEITKGGSVVGLATIVKILAVGGGVSVVLLRILVGG